MGFRPSEPIFRVNRDFFANRYAMQRIDAHKAMICVIATGGLPVNDKRDFL